MGIRAKVAIKVRFLSLTEPKKVHKRNKSSKKRGRKNGGRRKEVLRGEKKRGRAEDASTRTTSRDFPFFVLKTGRRSGKGKIKSRKNEEERN